MDHICRSYPAQLFLCTFPQQLCAVCSENVASSPMKICYNIPVTSAHEPHNWQSNHLSNETTKCHVMHHNWISRSTKIQNSCLFFCFKYTVQPTYKSHLRKRKSCQYSTGTGQIAPFANKQLYNFLSHTSYSTCSTRILDPPTESLAGCSQSQPRFLSFAKVNVK